MDKFCVRILGTVLSSWHMSCEGVESMGTVGNVWERGELCTWSRYKATPLQCPRVAQIVFFFYHHGCISGSDVSNPIVTTCTSFPIDWAWHHCVPPHHSSITAVWVCAHGIMPSSSRIERHSVSFSYIRSFLLSCLILPSLSLLGIFLNLSFLHRVQLFQWKKKTYPLMLWH